MTSSDETALPDDAKARAAARVGSSLDPAELVPERRASSGWASPAPSSTAGSPTGC